MEIVKTKQKRVIAARDQHICSTPGCTEPATTSVTDAVQQPDQTWRESALRFGCPQHPVEPMVHYLSGNSIRFADLQSASGNHA